MISAFDRARIATLARRFEAKRVLLFGSAAASDTEGHDIDLGVEGVRPEDFYRFYGELICSLSKPVDLVDLAEDSRFTRMVRRKGIPVYDAKQGAD